MKSVYEYVNYQWDHFDIYTFLPITRYREQQRHNQESIFSGLWAILLVFPAVTLKLGRWHACCDFLTHFYRTTHASEEWAAGLLSTKPALLSSNEPYRTATVGPGIVGFVVLVLLFPPSYIHCLSQHWRRHQEKCWCVWKVLPRFFFPQLPLI